MNQYMAATSTLLTDIFPKVTGRRFFMKKEPSQAGEIDLIANYEKPDRRP